ncbi:hypothetical protein Rin_00023070 [Candidatus Regiella insecticola 5.15]|uniref:KilA-N domain-containing protein n=1 Tax=Candidatus Regiella insecticola 5.15 TaxID=1005043 RepID=G2H2K0_9ENTR|nr:KilA-N domain-containing protein [Candidatus Regiella insecticola]EGY27781.1 hypothetical protein Rin_00023070 [Candidatus Regiella insecticola 5.15]
MMSKISLPVVAGVKIITDAEGRFNLNALHQASGAEKKNGPSYWFALDGTKALIQKLEQKLIDTEIPVSVVHSIKGGRNQGTYAHELLAISYAGWISPIFQLQVNQTFIDYRRGNMAAVAGQEKKNDYLAEFRQTRALKMAISSVHELFDMMPELSQISRQCVVANLINPIAGFEAIPLPVLAEKLYSASEIGKLFDVSANKIGRIANDNNMKTEQYGEYHLDKSRHSDKQVQAFRYNNHALNTFRHILIAEQEAKEHALV